MRAFPIALLVAAAMLAACDRHDTADAMQGKSPGRYAGIGTFEPGRLWRQITGTPASQDPRAAALADDEHIIVVLDSHTGEVRQCGDHSGVCVAMNPWSGNGAPIVAPVKLSRHAAELDSDAAESTQPEAKQE